MGIGGVAETSGCGVNKREVIGDLAQAVLVENVEFPDGESRDRARFEGVENRCADDRVENLQPGAD